MVDLIIPPRTINYIVVNSKKSNVRSLKMAVGELVLKYICELVKCKQSKIAKSFVRYMISIHEFVPYARICVQIKPYGEWMIPYIGSPSSIDMRHEIGATPTNVGIFNLLSLTNDVPMETCLLYSLNTHLWLCKGTLMVNAVALDDSDGTTHKQEVLFQQFLYMLCKLHEINGFDRPLLVGLGAQASRSIRQTVKSMEKKSTLDACHQPHPSILDRALDKESYTEVASGILLEAAEFTSDLAKDIGLSEYNIDLDHYRKLFKKKNVINYDYFDPESVGEKYKTASLRKWIPIIPDKPEDVLSDIKRYYYTAFEYIRSTDINLVCELGNFQTLYKEVTLDIISNPMLSKIMSGNKDYVKSSVFRFQHKCDQRFCSRHLDASLFDVIHTVSETTALKVESMIKVVGDISIAISNISKCIDELEKLKNKDAPDGEDEYIDPSILIIYEDALSKLNSVSLSIGLLIEASCLIRGYIRTAAEKNNRLGIDAFRVHKTNCDSYIAERIVRSNEKICTQLASFAANLTKDINNLSKSVSYMCEFTSYIPCDKIQNIASVMTYTLFDVEDIYIRFIEAVSVLLATYQSLEPSNTSMLGMLNATPPLVSGIVRNRVVNSPFSSMSCKERNEHYSSLHKDICESNNIKVSKTVIDDNTGHGTNDKESPMHKVKHNTDSLRPPQSPKSQNLEIRGGLNVPRQESRGLTNVDRVSSAINATGSVDEPPQIEDDGEDNSESSCSTDIDSGGDNGNSVDGTTAACDPEVGKSIMGALGISMDSD